MIVRRLIVALSLLSLAVGLGGFAVGIRELRSDLPFDRVVTESDVLWHDADLRAPIPLCEVSLLALDGSSSREYASPAVSDGCSRLRISVQDSDVEWSSEIDRCFFSIDYKIVREAGSPSEALGENTSWHREPDPGGIRVASLQLPGVDLPKTRTGDSSDYRLGACSTRTAERFNILFGPDN